MLETGSLTSGNQQKPNAKEETSKNEKAQELPSAGQKHVLSKRIDDSSQYPLRQKL